MTVPTLIEVEKHMAAIRVKMCWIEKGANSCKGHLAGTKLGQQSLHHSNRRTLQQLPTVR